MAKSHLQEMKVVEKENGPAEADRDRAVMFEPHDAAVVSLATLRGIIHQWISDRDGFDVAWAMR